MPVTSARTLSSYLIAALLVAAAALLITAHRTVPLAEGASIRLRYKALLMRVDPMTTPPGAPAVNVTEFESLARLAERHGLMILHWSRSDSETFVVRDEGTTYRYRTDLVTVVATADANAPA